MKVLHCPTTVGGNPSGLVKAEKSLAIDSQLWTLQQNYLAYHADKQIMFSGGFSLRDEWKRWKAIWRSLRDFDVLHYNFGQTLSPMRVNPESSNYHPLLIWAYNNLYARWFELCDLKIAHALKRAICVTYQGDDARQGDYCRKHYPVHFAHELGAEYYNATRDKWARERIAAFEKYAGNIYALNPDLLNVLPDRARFMPYASVDPSGFSPAYPDFSDESYIPHVVHAPSHRGVKGTHYILAAFERLKKEGVSFRYTLVENLPNSEAMKLYQTADLLVDQLLAGFYGGLSVELMAMGKPVICYLRDEDMKYLPEGMHHDVPVIKATPETIYDVLKLWLTENKAALRDVGMKSRRYVEKWHDPMNIAGGLMQDYQFLLQQRKNGI